MKKILSYTIILSATALALCLPAERCAAQQTKDKDKFLHYIVEGNIDPAILKACLQESMHLYCAAALSLKAMKHVTYELNGITYKLYE